MELDDTDKGILYLLQHDARRNGAENVQIDVVGTDSDNVAHITDELSEIALQVVNTKIIKDTLIQPFNHFGRHVVEEDRSEQ